MIIAFLLIVTLKFDDRIYFLKIWTSWYEWRIKFKHKFWGM